MVTVQSLCTRTLNILIDTPFCWDVGQHRRRWPLWAVTGHGNDSAKQISMSIELPSWKIDRKSNFCEYTLCSCAVYLNWMISTVTVIL